ncbi:hypothetical protein [Haloarchaeobius sp. DFWS5]|uniref:hypothetical protein n=1 Tax=Haloarchaeobius sp. DFWS5 TaxID=3446114 RepID=UPI003EBF02B0
MSPYTSAESLTELVTIQLDEDRRSAINKSLSEIKEAFKPEPSDWKPGTPANDVTLWRYMDFTQLVSILENEELWFSCLCQFDDPYEGLLPKGSRNEGRRDIDIRYYIKENSGEESVEVDEELLKTFFSDTSFANCWNIKDIQSVALWEQYLQSDEGVAIKTNIQNLKNSIDSDEDIIFGELKYIDFNDPDNSIPSSPHAPVFHKREFFEHENEFRGVVIDHSAPFNDEIPKSSDGKPKGIPIDIDTDTLIEDIYVSPTAPSWFSELVEDIVSNYGIDCEPIHSELYDSP